MREMCEESHEFLLRWQHIIIRGYPQNVCIEFIYWSMKKQDDNKFYDVCTKLKIFNSLKIFQEKKRKKLLHLL